jgi:hypothetical protein
LGQYWDGLLKLVVYMARTPMGQPTLEWNQYEPIPLRATPPTAAVQGAEAPEPAATSSSTAKMEEPETVEFEPAEAVQEEPKVEMREAKGTCPKPEVHAAHPEQVTVSEVVPELLPPQRPLVVDPEGWTKRQLRRRNSCRA